VVEWLKRKHLMNAMGMKFFLITPKSQNANNARIVFSGMMEQYIPAITQKAVAECTLIQNSNRLRLWMVLNNVNSTKKKSENEDKPLLKINFQEWFFHAVFREGVIRLSSSYGLNSVFVF
jgi:hypothetical protein